MPATHDDLPCPFCGLLCDDLSARGSGDQFEVDTRGCVRARERYARVMAPAGSCLVDGAPTTPEAALQRAAEVLRRAKRPLLLCGGAEVATLRALLALADRCSGIIDHHSSGLPHNLRVLQDSGWINTTLSEIRNRADVLLCVGTSVVDRFPRFFERCVRPGGLFDAARTPPRVIFLGAAPPLGMVAEHIAADVDALPAVIAQLRALCAGRQPTAATPALAELAATLRAARYGVVVWSAAALGHPHADLIIRALCEWIKDLNRETRVAGLPLAGTDGDVTALQVTLWQSGLPIPVLSSAAGPRHDAHRLGWQQQLRAGGADALLYVCEIDPMHVPPEVDLPCIVLGPHGMAPPRCEVFMPVGTPAVDRGGHLCRTDNVVTLHLKPLLRRSTQHAPALLAALLQKLEGAPA